MKLIKNTKLNANMPVKFDTWRIVSSVAIIVSSIVATSMLAIYAEIYSVPFAWTLEFIQGFGFSPGWSVIILSTVVYSILTALLIFSVYQQSLGVARTVLLEPENKKLEAWGTEHVIYRSTYDQMVSRLRYYNHAGASVSSLAVLSVVQAPITLGLLYVLRHNTEFSHSVFLGIPLNEKSLIMGLIVGIIYTMNSIIGVFTTNVKSWKIKLSTAAISMLIGLSMGFTVSHTAFGVGLYFITGGIIVLLRRYPLYWLREHLAQWLLPRVHIIYTAEDLISKGIDIKFNEDGLAIDADTNEIGKI